MPLIPEDEVSTLLPLRARQQLIDAARIGPRVPRGKCPERLEAIETATMRARLWYPELFHSKL